MTELWMRMKRGRCARKSSRSRERRLRSSRLTSSSCSSRIPPAFSSTSSCSALIRPCGASLPSDWPSSRNRNNCCKTNTQCTLHMMHFTADFAFVNFLRLCSSYIAWYINHLNSQIWLVRKCWLILYNSSSDTSQACLLYINVLDLVSVVTATFKVEQIYRKTCKVFCKGDIYWTFMEGVQTSCVFLSY